MKLNRTPNPLDRNARNSENKNWEIIEGTTIKVGEALDKSREALDKSEESLGKSIDTQNQLDNIIINSGTSDAEIIQARGKFPILRDRLNSTDQQLSDIATYSSSFESLQDAINATPEYGVLKVKKEEYLTNIFIDKPITIDFSGSEMKYSDTEEPIIHVKGSRSDLSYQLLSEVKRGDTQITLTTLPTDISVGDFIILRDDSARPGDGSTNINLEVHKVNRVIGETLILEDFVRIPKKTSPNNVYKINLLKNVKLLGMEFKGVENVPLKSPMILADMTENLVVNDVSSDKSIAPVLKISRSYNYKVDGFEACEPLENGPGQGYGIRVDGGSKKGEFRNGKGRRLRHLVDCGNAFDTETYDFDDYNSSSGSFVYSHNGYDGGNRFFNCHSYNAQYLGFFGSSQGFEGYYDGELYDLKLDGAKVTIDNGLRYSKGLSFSLPVKKGEFRNIDIEYLGNVVDSRAVEIPPVFNDLLFDDIRVKNAEVGFHLNIEGSPIDITSSRTAKFKNSKLIDCEIGFQFRSVRYIHLENIIFDNVSRPIELIYHANPEVNEKLHRLILKNIYVMGTDVDSFINWINNARPQTGIFGEIDNVTLEGLPSRLLITEGKRITLGDYIFHKKNGVIPIYSNSSVTTDSPFIDRNIIENEIITVVNTGDYPITLQGDSWVTGTKTIEKGEGARYIGTGERWTLLT